MTTWGTSVLCNQGWGRGTQARSIWDAGGSRRRGAPYSSPASLHAKGATAASGFGVGSLHSRRASLLPRQAGRLPRAGTSSPPLRTELLVLPCPSTTSLPPSGLSGALGCQPPPAPGPAPALGVPLPATPHLPVSTRRSHSSISPRPSRHQRPPKVAAPLTGTAENRRVQLPQVTNQQMSLTRRAFALFCFKQRNL